MEKTKVKKLVTSAITLSMAFSTLAPSMVFATDDVKPRDIVTKVNHALNGTATANNSETSYWGPDKAIDGIVNRDAAKPDQSRWSTNMGTTPMVLTIDLKEEKAFSEFKIEWERKNIKGFNISISNDNNEYTPVYTKPDDSNITSLTTTVTLENSVSARYVKLTVDNYDDTEAAGWASVSLYEFEVLGEESYENLAVGATAVASGSETTSFGPANVVDENMKTRWASTANHDDDKWISLDFGTAKDIASVTLKWERRNATKYKIQSSKNGTSWEDVKTLTKAPREFDDIINFDNTINTRYLRVVVSDFENLAEDRDGKSVNWPTVSLYEFEAYAVKQQVDNEQIVTIDDVINNLDDTNEELKKLLRQLKYVSGDVGDSVSDTMENLDNLVLNMSKELKGLKDTIKSFKDVLDKLGSTLPTLKPLPTLGPMTRPTATPSNGGSGGNSGGSDSNNDTSSESVKSEDDIDPGYNVTPDGELDSSYDVEPSVVGMLKDMLFTTAKAAETDDEKTAISDLKSTDISLPRLIGDENADTALVKYCINNGTVDGTESTGGVVGCVGFESIVRSGENLTLPDGTKVNSDSVLKAVIDSCISFGNVTAESKYAGGICGKSDIGDIKNSLTTGEITVNDGSYSGGTAGYTSGNIDNCIAINDVDGNDHIGGIAGSAKNINTSYSLPRLDGKKDDAGAIVGFVDGDVTGCYFIDEGLSGISGMNLEGRAEAVKPDDMTTSDGSFPSRMPLLDNGNFYMADGDKFLPQIKSLAQNDAESIGAILQSKSTELSRFHFNVIFKDKDKELKSMTVDYGTVLNDSDIPKLTADGSEVPMWDKDVKSPIIRHTTFSAEYNKATTTISSGEEPPLMLAESVFADNTTLSLKEEDVDHVFDGYKNGKAYSFTLSKDAYDVIKVHIRDDKKKAAKIAVQIDGKWSMVDCTIDGSYAVFETAKPCKYVLLYKKISPIVPIAICGGTAVLLMAVFIVLRRIKKHGRSKEKENV